MLEVEYNVYSIQLTYMILAKRKCHKTKNNVRLCVQMCLCVDVCGCVIGGCARMPPTRIPTQQLDTPNRGVLPEKEQLWSCATPTGSNSSRAEPLTPRLPVQEVRAAASQLRWACTAPPRQSSSASALAFN